MAIWIENWFWWHPAESQHWECAVYYQDNNFCIIVGQQRPADQRSQLWPCLGGIWKDYLEYTHCHCDEDRQRFFIWVSNLCAINPVDEDLVLKITQECSKIITCEEHSVIGGLGETVSALLKQFGPSAENTIKTALEFMKNWYREWFLAEYLFDFWKAIAILWHRIAIAFCFR